jgi:multidrug efflux pump subunit AcrA (membrane-fusion protein)
MTASDPRLVTSDGLDLPDAQPPAQPRTWWLPRREQTEPRPPVPVEELAAQLAQARQVADVRRSDELERLQAAAAHDRARADVAEDARLAELDRAEREASAAANAKLSRLYRESIEAGERTRLAAHMARSGEARALRLARTSQLNLKILVPILIGFATWSTTGVQNGAAWLMHARAWTPMWWALWLLEPVLAGTVIWIIIVRSRLATSGGRITARAVHIGGGCLTTSVLLNFAAAASTTTHWSLSVNGVLLSPGRWPGMRSGRWGPPRPRI